MPLNIKNEEAHQLAKELASITETSITEAVTTAIREAIERRKTLYEKDRESLIHELQEIAENTASLTDYDHRRADEILGYNEEGVPD